MKRILQPQTLKILIADDHVVMRIGLKTLLETEPGFVIVGEAGDGHEAIKSAARLQPDVVIMDLMMPRIDGIAATREIKSHRPVTKVLILTTFATSDGIANALDAGADGAILKNSDTEELFAAIRKIVTGGNYVSREIQTFMINDPPAVSLTEKQTAILTSLARGLTNRELAVQFGVSPNVIKGHLSVIFNKLEASNKAEAVAIALRKHLLQI